MFYKSIKGRAGQFLGNYKQQNPATFAAAQQAVGGLLILDGLVGIDNPLGGKKRSGIFGALLGTLVGLALVFGISFFGNFFGVSKMTATTTATVVSVSQSTSSSSSSNSGDTCTVQARYTVNGQEYTQTASSGSSSACSLVQGQTININYDPNSPGAFAYDLGTVKTALNIFRFAGALVVVTSMITFTLRLLSIVFGWKLVQSGRALAKTLPAGTDLATIQNEIKENFAKSVFGIGAGGNSQ